MVLRRRINHRHRFMGKSEIAHHRLAQMEPNYCRTGLARTWQVHVNMLASRKIANRARGYVRQTNERRWDAMDTGAEIPNPDHTEECLWQKSCHDNDESFAVITDIRYLASSLSSLVVARERRMACDSRWRVQDASRSHSWYFLPPCTSGTPLISFSDRNRRWPNTANKRENESVSANAHHSFCLSHWLHASALRSAAVIILRRCLFFNSELISFTSWIHFTNLSPGAGHPRRRRAFFVRTVLRAGRYERGVAVTDRQRWTGVVFAVHASQTHTSAARRTTLEICIKAQTLKKASQTALMS